MVKLEVIKTMDDKEVTLRFDDEYEAVLTLTAFQQMAERLSGMADDGLNHLSHWLFDPEDEPENVGCETRDIFAAEDE